MKAFRGLFTLKRFYFKQMLLSFVHENEGLFRANEIFMTNDPVSGGALFRQIPYTDDGQLISCECCEGTMAGSCVVAALRCTGTALGKHLRWGALAIDGP